MGLIDHDEVPLRDIQLRLKILVSGELVEPCEPARALGEGMAGLRRVHRLTREDLEGEPEAAAEFVLTGSVMARVHIGSTNPRDFALTAGESNPPGSR